MYQVHTVHYLGVGADIGIQVAIVVRCLHVEATKKVAGEVLREDKTHRIC